MKRMLSVLAVSVAVFCLSFNVSAQDSTRRGGGGMGGGRGTPEERAKRQTEQMVKALGLSADQTTTIDSINLKFAKEQQGGMRGQGAGGDREAWMAAMKKTQDEKNAAFKTALTEKQYADYLKWVEEQRLRMQERMGQQPKKDRK